MAQAKPPLGAVIENADQSHSIWDGKQFAPAKEVSPGQWSVDHEAVSRMGLGGGFDAAANTAKYQDKLAQARATSDMGRLDHAAAAEQQAYSNEATAHRAGELLHEDTPTGPMADMRVALGRSPLGHVGKYLPMVPTKEQTANLESMQALGNEGALGKVGELKGPLSDRDIAFLKSLQYSADASPKYNARVVEAQEWVAKRQAAYSAALRKWTENTGSPSALNHDGMSFDRWWGGYSALKLPPPKVQKPGAAAGKGDYRILKVE
jgi:hypothetical protein